LVNFLRLKVYYTYRKAGLKAGES